jgi:hypothetical protein
MWTYHKKFSNLVVSSQTEDGGPKRGEDANGRQNGETGFEAGGRQGAWGDGIVSQDGVETLRECHDEAIRIGQLCSLHHLGVEGGANTRHGQRQAHGSVSP